MRLTTSELGIRLTVSRRNLLALLAKLDGYPKNGHCSLYRNGVTIVAEEDNVHYGEREPGPMHQETEREMKRGRQQ